MGGEARRADRDFGRGSGRAMLPHNGLAQCPYPAGRHAIHLNAHVAGLVADAVLEARHYTDRHAVQVPDR